VKGVVLPYTARQFARAIVMPNLSPPVTSVEGCAAYRDRIQAAVPAGVDFTPLMTAYLTDGTDGEKLARGFAEGRVFTAAKLYPAHATTGSAHGVTDIAQIIRALEKWRRSACPC
jgi:dihydroorotase